MARRQNRAGETEEQAMKVADIHAHIFPEKLADKAPASISAFYGGMDVACHPATAENLVKFEHEAGITRFVMSNSATSAHQVRSINDFLPQAAKDVPGAIAFGSIFPGMDGAEEELERAKALGIRGLKVHPIFRRCPSTSRAACRSTARRQSLASRSFFTWETTGTITRRPSGF